MSLEDFVGRWVAGNDRRQAVTIEIRVADDRPVVCAISNFDGEVADIHDMIYSDGEVRFAARWKSDRTSTYRLLRSGDRLVVDRTVSDREHFARDLHPDGTHKWRSGIMHVAPGYSAGGSLRMAVEASDRTDNVIPFFDDLSCGPIDSDDPSARFDWWGSIYDGFPGNDRDERFWVRLDASTDHLVVWFSRHSAMEYAFFLALTDRLGDRPFHIIDVTGIQLPITRPRDMPRLSRPKQAVSIITESELTLLLGTERPITAQEREDAVRRWRRLRSENAPFRIVTETGLVSAPADVFDNLLLEHATKEWRKVARVIGDTMGHNMEPYIQAGDMMLLTRIVALVESGRLIAHGDPWRMRQCEVRLPD
jgi:hypothetical protein